MLNKSGMTLKERAQYEQYIKRTTAKIKTIPWTWFVSLNTSSNDINTVHEHVRNYLCTLGGIIGHRYRYCLAICEHESAFTSDGITPLHIHGFIQCPDTITGEQLRSEWLDRRDVSSYVRTGEQRDTLIGRTFIERYDPTKDGVSYTVAQSVGVIITNVAAIKSILQGGLCNYSQ